MSISDTITSIENHIQADYEGLENIGADLTGINKNILNIRTILDNIYNDLPKVTGEGTEVTLTPTRKGRLVITPKGNSTQESTTGKNILGLISPSSTEFVLANVTCTPVYKNGLLQYINLNGTASGTPTQRALGSISFKEGQSYTISGVTGFTTSTLQLYTSSTSAFPAGNRLNSADGKTTRVAQADETCEIRLYVYAGVTYNNAKVYPMVCENNTDDTYEPYTNGPAPNPSYPFPIKSVTGNNNVVVNSLNLMDTSNYTTTATSGVTVTRQDNGTFLLNGTYTGNTFIDFQNNIELNGDYTLFLIKTNTANAYLNIYSDNAHTTANRIELVSGNNYKNFTYTGQCLSQRINIEPGTYNNDIIKVMLVKGTYSSLIDYVEYQNQTKPLNLGSIELNKIGTYQDYIYKTSGKNLLNASQKSYTLPKDENTTVDIGTVEMVQGKTYYITYNVDTNSSSNTRNTARLELNNLWTQHNSSTNYNLTAGRKTWTFIAPSTGTAHMKYWLASSNVDVTISDYMVSELSDITYEPYGSGIWYKHEEIKKVVLNGSEENWSVWFSTAGAYSCSNLIESLQNSQQINCMCDSFLAVTRSYARNNLATIDNVCATNGGEMILINKSITTKDAFKTWLGTHNTTLYTILATATDIEITDSTLISQLEEIDKMKSYEGTTIITSTFDSNNAQMIISASGLKGE